MRQRLSLWLARLALFASIALTLTLAYAWRRSIERPEEFVRTRWLMSSTTDDIWRTRIHLIRGSVSVLQEHRAEPAFTGAFVVDLPFATNRTEPAGVTWERSPSPLPYIDSGIWGAGSSDGPRWLERLGIGWKMPRNVGSGFGNFNATQGWVQVALGPMIFASCVVTFLLTFAWWRSGRGGRRAGRGLCATCGYDLRESPDRCPECGAVRGGAQRVESVG